MPFCPICKSETAVVQNLYDDRFGHSGYYEIRQCTDCYHCFVNKIFSESELSLLYTTYYQRSNFDPSKFVPAKMNRGFFGWLNGEKSATHCWVPESVCILDVGCGFGETLAYHESRGCLAHGIEVDENVQYAIDQLGLTIRIGTLESNHYDSEFFDYVTMSQVVEHLPEPVKTLKEVYRILKSEGRLILSTPNSYGWGRKVFGWRWINWHIPYHLNLFSRKSLSIVAEEAGFKVEKIKTITASDWLYYQLVHLFNYPKHGVPSIFWSKGRTWTRGELWTRRAIKVIHFLKITHIVTRFYDGLGLGDELLVILRKK